MARRTSSRAASATPARRAAAAPTGSAGRAGGGGGGEGKRNAPLGTTAQTARPAGAAPARGGRGEGQANRRHRYDALARLAGGGRLDRRVQPQDLVEPGDSEDLQQFLLVAHDVEFAANAPHALEAADENAETG